MFVLPFITDRCLWQSSGGEFIRDDYVRSSCNARHNSAFESFIIRIIDIFNFHQR
jgi:hypothetical protein